MWIEMYCINNQKIDHIPLSNSNITLSIYSSTVESHNMSTHTEGNMHRQSEQYLQFDLTYTLDGIYDLITFNT